MNEVTGSQPEDRGAEPSAQSSESAQSRGSRTHGMAFIMAAAARRFGASMRALARWVAAIPGWLLAHIATLLKSIRGSRLLGPVLRGARILVLAGFLGLAGWKLATLCTVRIHPGEIGVLQRDLGGGRGIEGTDHGPGLYLALPFRTTWHRLDARTQVTIWSFEREGGDDRLLELRTPEGNAVQATVAVPWRVREGEAHRIVADGSKLVYAERVRGIVQKVVARELTGLESEELADPVARDRAAEAALEALRAELQSHHVEPLAVLLTGEYFAMPYEKAQQEQQLAQQERLTQDVLARVQARKLENDSVTLQVDDRNRTLTRELTRVYDDARRAAEVLRERQAQANQALAQEIESERAELRAEHESAMEAQHLELGVREKERKTLALEVLEEDIQQALARRKAELELSLSDEQQVAELMAESLGRQLELAQEGLEADATRLQGELAAVVAEQRLALMAEARELTREAESSARTLLAEAELRAQALEAEGREAISRIEIDHEAAMAGLLNSEAGELYLARQAAGNLSFGHVALDPSQPGVPSPLDLEALMELVLGSGGR